MHRIGWVLALFAAFWSGAGAAQTKNPASDAPPTQLPQFEVASVRPSGPQQHELNGLRAFSGGRVVGNGCTLQFLIMVSYSVQPFQISGGAAWTNIGRGDRFDIEARPQEDSASAHWVASSPRLPLGDEELKMLQSLLAERFRLQIRHDLKEGQVYQLIRGSSALKLMAPKHPDEGSWAGGISGGLPDGEGLRGTNISMPELVLRLSRWLGRPVIDKTGLQGSFDFEYRSGAVDSVSNTDGTDSILTSIKGIGLALEASKGTVETIVIEHAERPAEN